MKLISHILVFTLSVGLICPDLQGDTLPDRFRALPAVGGGLTSVVSIVQDGDGYMWLGSADGLVRYDGYSYRTYRHSADDPASLCNNMVNVLYLDPESGQLYVGTDEGVCIYDAAADSFVSVQQGEKRHVKDIARDGNSILVGTTSGLLRLREDGSAEIYRASGYGMQSDHIASILVDENGVWLGSYDHLYRLREAGGFDDFPLSEATGGKNVLVLDITPDLLHEGHLWLGTEAGLVNFVPETGDFELSLKNVPVKNFLSSDGNLWLGTDYGLYVLEGPGRMVNFRHEVGNGNSLPDNVIWCISKDRDGNLWFGTDHGVALTEGSKRSRFIDVGRMTGSTDGLDVGVIAASGKDVLWLGGRNGLIKYNLRTGAGKWYKSDSGPADERLAHNKVRACYNDGQGLWVASDGGLDFISGSTGKVRHFHLVEPTERYSSNWMYSIGEDRFGRLWAGTYDGGLFVVEKRSLLTGGSNGVVLCNKHFSSVSDQPISSDVIRHVAFTEDYAVAGADSFIDIISLLDFGVKSLTLAQGENVTAMLADADSVWIGTDKGVYSLVDGQLHRAIDIEIKASSLMKRGDELWVLSSESLFVLSKDGEWSRIPAKDMLLSGISVGERMFFGTVDGVVEMERPEIAVARPSMVATITGLIFNNEAVEVGREYFSSVVLPQSVGCIERVVLPHEMNTFSVEFSSFDYGASDGRYAYRLKGFDPEWQHTTAGEHRAVFINVPRGEYVFEVAALPEQEEHGEVTALGIRVRPVWYATGWAFLGYLLGICGLGLLVAGFLRTRNRLKIEQVEKDEALRTAEMSEEALGKVSKELYLTRLGQRGSDEGFDEKLMQEVVEIVERHLEDPEFSAGALCAESRYSSKQIYRKIKQLTGMSIVEYIRDTRLRKAVVYLEQGKFSVTEVMYKVGFTTGSYFAKCFKEKYGMTPSEYTASRAGADEEAAEGAKAAKAAEGAENFGTTN